MPTEIVTTLISSVIGGLFVAVVNLLFMRNRTAAETEKLRAEAEKIKAEARKIAIEAENIQAKWQNSVETFQAQSQLLQMMIDRGIIEDYELQDLSKKLMRKIVESSDEKE